MYIILLYIVVVVILLLFMNKLFNKIIKKEYDLFNNHRSLLVIAHPDDDLIFAHDVLFNYNNLHVICLSHYTYPNIRYNEFVECMNYFNINKYKLLDFEDRKDIKWDINKIKDSILNYINLNGLFTNIITHNKNGEYGHPHHIACNKALENISTHFFHEGTKYNWDYKKEISYNKLYKSQYNVKKKFKKNSIYYTIIKK